MTPWTPKPPDLKPTELNILLDVSSSAPIMSCTLQELIDNSDQFPIAFPVDTGRLKTLKKQVPLTQLTKNINSTYPFLHEHVLKLYAKFIEFKKDYGSAIEKQFYNDMLLKSFIDRLLKKRAVTFVGRYDRYQLLSGETGANHWDKIGTAAEKPPLTLENCLSYDEVKLSAFLYVSSYTHFINRGDRRNNAKLCEDRSNIQEEGVIAGMIGPRLKKPLVMDYQEIVITPEQNQAPKGYGSPHSMHQLLAHFYEDKNCTYASALQRKSSGRYQELSVPKGALFDNHIYQKRLAIVFDCLLFEANVRAKEANCSAYVHVVGLGLGVWRASDHQEKVFMECFYNRIISLSEKLSSISDICFSYFKENCCGPYKNDQLLPIPTHPSGGITIHIFNRQPHDKLVDCVVDAPGKLLVVSYAWDGNALPGNEYWCGNLSGSGDSAAASSTQVAELHNPHINRLVCADNVRVVTTAGEIVRLSCYSESLRLKERKRGGEEEGKGEGTRKKKK